MSDPTAIKALIADVAARLGATPGPSVVPPSGEFYRDEQGREFYRLPPRPVRWGFPDGTETLDPGKGQSGGVSPAAWKAVGCERGALRWSPGTVAYITGPRATAVALAYWVALQLAKAGGHDPIRFLSARDLPPDDWEAVPGNERTLVVADVVTIIGRPRLSQVGALLAARGKRSMVLTGEPIPESGGDQWDRIRQALSYDGARMVAT